MHGVKLSAEWLDEYNADLSGVSVLQEINKSTIQSFIMSISIAPLQGDYQG